MSKFMRIIVFFDLPVSTKTERYLATSFRRFLLNDGYYMLQFSVYARLCNSVENAEQHFARLEKEAPERRISQVYDCYRKTICKHENNYGKEKSKRIVRGLFPTFFFIKKQEKDENGIAKFWVLQKKRIIENTEKTPETLRFSGVFLVPYYTIPKIKRELNTLMFTFGFLAIIPLFTRHTRNRFPPSRNCRT